MPETNDSPYPVSEPVSEAAAARAKFEQEKMSRRAALRKIGLTSGMALFGMLAVDDFARLALRGLQQHKETQAVAETVAQELRSSGVAFAADGDDDYYDGGPCTPEEASMPSCAGGRKRKRKHINIEACNACVTTKTACLQSAEDYKTACYQLAGSDQDKRHTCDVYVEGREYSCHLDVIHCCEENRCNCNLS